MIKIILKKENQYITAHKTSTLSDIFVYFENEYNNKK